MVENEAQNVKIKSNTKLYIIIGLAFLILGFGGFLYWASTMEIAQGVVAMGQVAPQGRKVALQHQYGGTIEKIKVKDGDFVDKGELLFVLDDSKIEAELQSTRWEYISLLTTRARLVAERLGYEKIKYPGTVTDYADEPEVQRMMNVQEELFKSRRESLKTELNILEKQRKGQLNYIRELRSLIEAKKNQINLIQEEINNVKELVSEGYYPRSKYNELKRTLNQYISDMQEQLSIIEKTKASIAEIEMKKFQIRNQFNEKIDTKLSEIETKINQVREQYQSLQHHYNSMKVKAPVDGIVMDKAFNSVGGVIKPGQRILSIVPAKEELIVEAKVNPQDIDSVKIGQKTELRFSALDATTTPSLFGKVTYISADTLQSKDGKAEYYLVRISVSKDELQKLNNKKIFPGLPAQVIIKGEDRTFVEYIMKPLMDRLYFALREE